MKPEPEAQTETGTREGADREVVVAVQRRGASKSTDTRRTKWNLSLRQKQKR